MCIRLPSSFRAPEGRAAIMLFFVRLSASAFANNVIAIFESKVQGV
jgi:hypothetical protein